MRRLRVSITVCILSNRTVMILSILSSAALVVSEPENQLHCMATNIYHEAGNQSEKGKIAVANVVMNRIKSQKYPDSPCDVIYQRSKRGCQFSWVCSRKKVKDYSLYEKCLKIAKIVYFGNTEDVTNGAIYFSRSKSNRGLRIGDHVFRK